MLLLQTYKDYHILKRPIYFTQDNDSKHTSQTAANWFKYNHIHLLPWASSSPNMNIIEHIQDYINWIICAQEVQAGNKEEAWAALQKEYYKISTSCITKLYQSLLTRVSALKKARGRHIKYQVFTRCGDVSEKILWPTFKLS